MTRRAVQLLLLAAALAPAQSLDLQGPWRARSGDDPAFAQPTLDDSAWSTQSLPRQGRVKIGVSWLRRRVTVPASTSGLAIAIGSATHCTDVYLDGRRLGDTACHPDADPPFFAPRVLPIPAGWLTPGQPILIALRLEGRRNTTWSGTATGFLDDEGPYALGPAAELAPLAESAKLRLERRVFMPNSLLGWNSFSAGLLLLALWAGNRHRWELFWFGCFQMFIAWLNVSQVRAVYLGTVTSGFLLAATLSYVCLNLGAYATLFGRPLSWAKSLALALAIPLAGQLIAFGVQVPAMVLPAWWAAQRLRARGRITDRLFALAILAYALASLNSVANRFLPGVWPIPGAFLAGNFIISTVAVTNGLLSAALVLLLVVRLGEDWRERQKLSAEFDAARTVQRLLLDAPAGAGAWQAEAVYSPALDVGGDFYQTLHQPDGSLLVVVGDVSGKGLEAAMVASVAVGAFRAARDASPAAVLRCMNEALAGMGRTGFVTCCCARFNAGGVTIANAGHPAPYADGVEAQLDSGLPLGLTTAVEYTDSPLPGQRFTFVSDGVVEAANAAGELFGFDRTRAASTQSASAIATAAQQWGQNDDITVVTVQRTA